MIFGGNHVEEIHRSFHPIREKLRDICPGCGKTGTPPAGSRHFSSAYDTFTGHLGPALGISESISPGQASVGFGPGGASLSISRSDLCVNWVMLAS